MREVSEIDSAYLLRHLGKGLCHLLEVGFLFSAALPVSLLNWLGKFSTKRVEALNVRPDNFKMTKDVVLTEFVRVVFSCLADFGPNEGSIHVVGKRRWIDSLTFLDEFLMNTTD